MNRRSFLAAIPAAALLLGADDQHDVDIPAVLDGGRFFAVPRAGGAVMKMWLDTDGAGFVFQDAVRRLHLATYQDLSRTYVRLPPFDPAASIPEPLGRGGMLRLYVPDAADRADPILRGFDGQLGASWFQGRVWRFDYPAARVTLLSAPIAAPALGVRFDVDAAGRRRDGAQFPRFDLGIGGRSTPAAFDTAASVSLTGDGARRLGLPRGGVFATSFVKRAVYEAWRTAHAEWPTAEGVGTSAGIDAIQARSVGAGAWTLANVWFTTRPGDDVFEVDPVDVKLGANAYADLRVEIDYPSAKIRFVT